MSVHNVTMSCSHPEASLNTTHRGQLSRKLFIQIVFQKQLKLWVKRRHKLLLTRYSTLVSIPFMTNILPCRRSNVESVETVWVMNF